MQAVAHAITELRALWWKKDITAIEIAKANTIKERLFTLAKTDTRLANVLGNLHKKYNIQFAPEAERGMEANFVNDRGCVVM